MVERVLLAAVMTTLLPALATPVHPWTIAGAAVAAVLIASLVRLAPHRDSSSSERQAAIDATMRDEHCRRGAFRRQTHPAAPGRPLPRAPQPA